MTIERPDRTGLRRVSRPVGPAGFDRRELELAESILHHVLLRDACLAPSGLIAGKLDRLDRHRWREPVSGTTAGRDSHAADEFGQHVGVVAQIRAVRRRIHDTGSLLAGDRRKLVLLDVLASLPESPEAGIPWSRSPIDLIGEAAAGIGYSPSDIRRVAHRMAVARTALPAVQIGPSTTRTLAEGLRAVVGMTPGAAAAHAVLLLSDRVPTGWSPSACGAVVLDPAPRRPSSGGPGEPRFLGSIIARHDLAAFVEDLATLRVAADVSPTIGRYAAVMLPELASELHRTARDEDVRSLGVAAEVAGRTADLLSRGFRLFDRAAQKRRFHLLA